VVYKIFVLLLTVNLFAVVAKAEASELLVDAEFNSMVAGDDEILIEKGVSKSKCLSRVVSMLGSHWFNNAVELQRMATIKREGSTPRYTSSFQDGLAKAKYGLDVVGDQFSVSMNMKF
jgi:hypothetical protein